MRLITIAAVYFLVWWLVWFAVLPWGVKSQHEADSMEPGTDPGAPQRPLLVWKIAATSVVAAVLTVVFYAVWDSGIVPFERWPMPFTSPTG